MKTKKKLVMVVWRDANTAQTDEPQGDFIMYTVGWLRKVGPKWTTISNERTGSPSWRGHTRIPTQTVLDIQRLAVKRKPRKGDA